MKKLLIALIVIVILVAIGFLTIGKAPKDVERANIGDTNTPTSTTTDTTAGPIDPLLQKKIEDFDLANLNFKFTGYGPGKSHEGTFTDISISNIEHNNSTITKGTIKFFVESVDTGIGKLDTDLCFENFFNCAAHKEITFTLTGVERKSATELTATGDLTMKGITKPVSFPVTQNGSTFSSQFILDVAQFGFTAPSIVDNEVQIEFDATL